mgnify:CR=1 FL=1
MVSLNPSYLASFWSQPVVEANLLVFLNLGGAMLLGLLLGYERSYHGRAAGMRTYGIVCMASAALTVFAGYPEYWWGGSLNHIAAIDPTRVVQGIVTGVGFLGAGVILKDQGRVSGLTTAAAIWVTAAIGMGIGSGFYTLALTGAALVFIALWGVPRVTSRLQARYAVTYRATCHRDSADFGELTQRFRDARLIVNRSSLAKSGDRVVFSWQVYGDPDRHEAVESLFVADPAVLDFEVL